MRIGKEQCFADGEDRGICNSMEGERSCTKKMHEGVELFERWRLGRWDQSAVVGLLSNEIAVVESVLSEESRWSSIDAVA